MFFISPLTPPPFPSDISAQIHDPANELLVVPPNDDFTVSGAFYCGMIALPIGLATIAARLESGYYRQVRRPNPISISLSAESFYLLAIVPTRVCALLGFSLGRCVAGR